MGVDEIRSLSMWATGSLLPDLTLLIDVPPEVAARRRGGEPDRMERESMEFHERVRHQYLALADSEADRIVVIDGVGTEDQVFSEIRGVLEERVDAAFQGLPEEAAEDTKPVESQATLWALLEEDGILL